MDVCAPLRSWPGPSTFGPGPRLFLTRKYRRNEPPRNRASPSVQAAVGPHDPLLFTKAAFRGAEPPPTHRGRTTTSASPAVFSLGIASPPPADRPVAADSRAATPRPSTSTNGWQFVSLRLKPRSSCPAGLFGWRASGPLTRWFGAPRDAPR